MGDAAGAAVADGGAAGLGGAAGAVVVAVAQPDARQTAKSRVRRLIVDLR
jgi:hypothetical protein